MIVDSHCHAWPRWPYQPAVPDDEHRGRIEQLVYEMDRNGVDEAVLICARIDRNADNNEYISQKTLHQPHLHQFPDVDCSWSPTYHQPGASQRLRETSDRWPVRGFTHYLKSDDGSWLYSDEGIEFFRVATERNLIASIACAPHQQPAIRKVAERFPTLSILCHHLKESENVTRYGRMNRREFLKLCSGSTAGMLLAACGIGESADKRGAKPGARSGKPISFLVRTDIKSAYAVEKVARVWNKEFESQVRLDTPPTGWDVTTKIQAAQVGGDVSWDGYAVMVVPWDSAQWVSRGLIQPLDEYIKASKIPNADKVIPGVIPSIRETLKVNGKTYAIPGNVGSVALAWMTEPFEKAGIKGQPMTWDEVYSACRKLKDAEPKMTPFGSAQSPLTDLWAMIWGATKKPLRDDGLVDITGDPSVAALKWMQRMVQEGLMPKSDQDVFTNWTQGHVSIITSYDVAGTIAQQTFGNDAAVTGINYFHHKNQHEGGTPFWTNSCVVLDKAKNPQGMTDFLLWFFGPDNKSIGKQITEVAAKPCYQYMYDEFVKGKPDYEWEQQGIEVVRDSVPFPNNNYQSIETTKTKPWIEKVLDPGQKMDPEQAMNEAIKDIKTEIKKQSR